MITGYPLIMYFNGFIMVHLSASMSLFVCMFVTKLKRTGFRFRFSLFLCLFLYNHMYYGMHVHAFYQIQIGMCVCQGVHISLLLLGFTCRRPACFGSTPWSHIMLLWSVTPADIRLEVNGGNMFNLETTKKTNQWAGVTFTILFTKN